MKRDTFTAHAAAHDGDADEAPAPSVEGSPPSLGLVAPAENPPQPSHGDAVAADCATKPTPRSKHVGQSTPNSLALPDVLAALLDCGRLGGEPIAAHLWIVDSADLFELLDSSESARPTPLEDADPRALLKRALDEQCLVLEPLRRVTTIEAETTVWRLALPVASGDDRGVAVLDFAAGADFSRKRVRKAARALAGYLSGALALRRLNAASDSVHDLTDALGSLANADDPHAVVSECLARAIELVHADSGSIMLLDPDSHTMRIAASIGLASDVVGSTEVAEGEGISGWVLATRQPLAIEDLDGKSPRSEKQGKRSAISVPLSDSEGILGVINVARRGYRGGLTRPDLEAMRSLGRFSAIVLRRARLAIRERETYFGILASLAAAMEAGTHATGISSQRVVELAVELGVAMHLGHRDLEALRIAALLHDVGMVAARDAVAVSGRPLSTVEWGMLKMHPLVAVDILAQVPALVDVVPVVRYHHERWDGSGYVAGIAADEIPLDSRIIAVADAFVAMTSDRPYRSAMSTKQALAELSTKAGSQFDPNVVRVLAEELMGPTDASS